MELNPNRNGLFFVLFLVLWIPSLQHYFKFINSIKLNGVVTDAADVDFSYSKWWTGGYQTQKTLFLNDNSGFRPELLKINNQVEFSFFKKINAQNIYLGHDDYLFDKEYVDEYEGTTYLGKDVIRNELMKLKCIQDTFQRMRKSFLLIYAPSKPYYVPEKIPETLLPRDGKKMSNYETFRALGDSIGINQLDFNGLFMKIKDTSHNALMTKQGFHWSFYGSLLCADSLVKYIEQKRKIKMPELVLTEMHQSESAQKGDNDIALFANLLLPTTKEMLCYPDFHYDSAATKTKPATVYIGDSFVWQWVHNGFMRSTNIRWEFWYYFNTVWNQEIIDNDSKPINILDHNWQKSMNDADCIVVVFNPTNLRLFKEKTFLVEKLYGYFYPGRKQLATSIAE